MGHLLTVWGICLRFDKDLENQSPLSLALTLRSIWLYQQSPPENRTNYISNFDGSRHHTSLLENEPKTRIAGPD